jgi:hypothetical protein
MVGSIACALFVVAIQDIYKYWDQCRHDWTNWSTPEKPEVNYYTPTYAYQTRCCKKCNEFEKREIK